MPESALATLAPDWAGEIVYADMPTASTTAEAEEVWAAAENTANSSRWSVAERDPGTALRLRSRRRLPGTAWLEMTVAPKDGGGSTYTQRTIFIPAGVRGRLFWYLARLLHAVVLAALARNVIGGSG
jgi:hypothetical protein